MKPQGRRSKRARTRSWPVLQSLDRMIMPPRSPPSATRTVGRMEGASLTNPFEAKLEILADPEALSHRVADWLLEMATAKDGIFAIDLSGGSTPRRLYECLAGPPYRNSFPWSRTHWFWGDERFVPHDDALSNYRMVREALLSRAPIPALNVHPIPTEGVSPEAAASAYERQLKSFYGAECLDPARPLFDVTLLGLGPDGHTASLFPGTAVLAEQEPVGRCRRWRQVRSAYYPHLSGSRE